MARMTAEELMKMSKTPASAAGVAASSSSQPGYQPYVPEGNDATSKAINGVHEELALSKAQHQSRLKQLLDEQAAGKQEARSTASFLPGEAYKTMTLDPAVGMVKGAASTVAGASELGEKLILNPIDKVMGKESAPSLAAKVKEKYLKPDNLAQKIGFTAEQIAELFIPGGAATKTEAVAGKAIEKLPKAAQGITNLAAKSGIEAATLGGATAIQTGGDKEATKNAAISAAAFPVASAAVKGVAKLAEGSAAKVINNLIKPANGLFQYGKDAGRGVVNEGIVASNLDDLGSKVSEKRTEVGKLIGEEIQSKHPDASINLTGLTQFLDDALEKANKSPKTNSALIQRLEDAKSDILGMQQTAEGLSHPTLKVANRSLQEAMNLKQQIADITKYTGNPTDDKAANKALQQTYAFVRDKMTEAAPALKKLLGRYADLASADVAISRRLPSQMKADPFALGKHLLGATSALAALATGNYHLLAGVGADAALTMLSSTASKTMLAQTLHHMTPEAIDAAAQKIPWFATVIGRVLGDDNSEPKEETPQP